MRTLQFAGNVEDIYTDFSGPGARTSNRTENIFRMQLSGSKFRYNIDFRGYKGSVNTLNDQFVVCYDGRKYQAYSKRRGTLAFASDIFSVDDLRMDNPLIIPYIFLFSGRTPGRFANIRDRSTWSDFIHSAEYVGDETFQGNKVAVVDFSKKSEFGTHKIRVYFLSDFSYYPISAGIVKNGQIDTITEVLDYHIYKSDDVDIIIPTDVKLTLDGYTEQAKIDDLSVIFNETIDEDVFTFSPTSTNKVLDWDRIFSEENKRNNEAMGVFSSSHASNSSLLSGQS